MAASRRKPVFERLFSHIAKTEGCWEWNGYRDHSGYGRLMTENGPVRAHRLSYIVHNGPIPEGKYVLHTCDHPWCTNPDHLYVGTHDDNMADKTARGRNYTGEPQRGEAHGRSKITADVVRAIRASTEPNPTLALRYGVSSSNVCMIKRRKTWAHIP